MTILFEQDWLKYPNAIADTNTSNKSFIRICQLIREIGVKNCMFPLALLDRSLVGVNPHDPNISIENQLKVAYECKINTWYFMREVARVPPIAGGDAIPLEANRGNVALYWYFMNHVMTILIQIRQTGKSLSTDLLSTLLLNIQCTSTEINLLTKDDGLRSKNIQKLKDIALELPFYLQQKSKLDSNNTEEITIKALGNIFRAHVPQASQKAAYKVGRGLTSPIMIIDEAPFQPNIQIALEAALPARTAAVGMAKINNAPYGVVFTTSVGRKDDRDGAFMYNFISEAAEHTEKFYDCIDIDDLEACLRRNSRTGKARVNITLNHKQLGKTDQWLKQVIEDNVLSEEAANRELGNVWSSGTEHHPLPLNVLEQIRQSQTPENHKTISRIGGYIIKWFIPEDKKEHILSTGKFVMSMDTSDASGGDDISLFLTDVSTGATIATGVYNETNLIILSAFISSWLEDYENILVCIERKSSGVMILDYLLQTLPAKGIDPFKRLFNRIVNDYDEVPEAYKEIQVPMGRRSPDIYVRYKKAFGFATAGTGVTSRSELFSVTLQNAAKKIGSKVKDIITINQIASLVYSNGRIDHQKGNHDDMVIAWLLNYWLLSGAKNLSYYGIHHNEILTNIYTKKELTPIESYDDNEQNEIRKEIQIVLDKIKTEPDELITKKLENRLTFLSKKIVLQEGEILSVDELINSAKEEKRRRRTGMANSLRNNNGMSVYETRNDYAVYDSYANYKNPRKVFG